MASTDSALESRATVSEMLSTPARDRLLSDVTSRVRFSPLPAECVAQFGDDGAEILDRDRVGEVQGRGHHVFERPWEFEPLDDRPVVQVGTRRGARLQVDELFTDRGSVGHHRRRGIGDLWSTRVQHQFHAHPRLREPQGADPARRDAEVGDLGIGEDAT